MSFENPDAFVVACGEEASDPLVLHEGDEVRVDELAASGHLDNQDSDLADVERLGVTTWRYGMPWRLTEPEPGTYDWTLWDRAFAACERNRLAPVVDLCHFGLPDHYPGFARPEWIEGFQRYVDAFLDRYPEPTMFTPVNEPMITAMCSGMWGVWNDRLIGRDNYFRTLANVVVANLEAIARIDADRSGWWIGAEGFGCHTAATADDEQAATTARELDRLTWDLHFGVEAPESVADVYAVVDDATLSRIEALAAPRERVVAGHDFYPINVTVHGAAADAEPPTIAERVAAYEAEARVWHQRYQRPFWVAETSNLGLPSEDGAEWIESLVEGIDRMRSDGLPARGVCWYSRGDQFDWHTMLIRPIGEVTEVGLFDRFRNPRPVAETYARLAAEG